MSHMSVHNTHSLQHMRVRGGGNNTQYYTVSSNAHVRDHVTCNAHVCDHVTCNAHVRDHVTCNAHVRDHVTCNAHVCDYAVFVWTYFVCKMHVLLHVQVRGNGVTLHTNDATQGYAIYRVTRSSMY